MFKTIQRSDKMPRPLFRRSAAGHVGEHPENRFREDFGTESRNFVKTAEIEGFAALADRVETL